MKALSVQEPWAAAIALGHKPIENRTWMTRYRGALLIHASKTIDRDWFDRDGYFRLLKWYRSYYGSRVLATGMVSPWPGQLYRVEEFPTGAIVGIARLTDVITEHDHRAASSVWFNGPFGWMLEEIRPLPEIPCRGMPGLFSVSEEIEQAVREQLGAAEYRRYCGANDE